MTDRIERALRVVRECCPETPSVGVVLGSGWGSIVAPGAGAVIIPYASVPGFPPCSVEGHAGDLVIDRSWGPLTAFLRGRAHHYEGWSLADVTFPVRILAMCGMKTLVVTNASGGLCDVKPGEVALIADHVNLMGGNPLIGAEPSEPRFVDMAEAYDPRLLSLAEEVARKEGIPVRRVTLAAVPGPSYETPAEAQMLRVLGAHVVCMSTVPEVIVARALGVRVLGLSLVANMAGATDHGRVTHDEVVAMGRRQASLMERLLRGIVGRLHG